MSLPSVAGARLKGHEGPIHVVRFTSDGKYCLTGGNDRTIRLWNPLRVDPAFTANSTNNHSSTTTIPDALPIQTYSSLHTYPISSLAIDQSSQTLISSSEKTLIISDVVTGKFIRKLHGTHTGRINSVACSSDASLFLSASYDATVRIWDGRSRSQTPIQTLSEAQDSVSSVLLLIEKGGGNQNEILTSSVDGCVRTYDIRMGQLRVDQCTNEAITSICPSHDGLCLAVSCLDSKIHLLEKESGELLNTYSSNHHHKGGKYGLECGITSNDEYVVSGSEDGKVVVYNLVDGSVANVLQHGHSSRRPVCSIAVHPRREKCSVVLSAGYDGEAFVWASPEEVGCWER